jgi:hypothetical protein
MAVRPVAGMVIQAPRPDAYNAGANPRRAICMAPAGSAPEAPVEV